MKSLNRVLLLENINPLARDLFLQNGFQVETVKTALSGQELIDKVKNYDILGIRSKTQLTAEILEKSAHLQAVGCFCVGTNQVDLTAAKKHGVAVFNAPFSNTRSVAEMVMGEIAMLSRQLGARNIEMHQGIWNKTSNHCFEIRGKTLGIIGYGNIGTQIGHLAEAFGMRVVFYDIISKLSLGNSRPEASLENLLEISDFVTLHVPETDLTQKMLGPDELTRMKKGSFLINASRGTVVDLQALSELIKTGHIAGAAIDVFPVEPESNSPGFKTPLQELNNVILTPHIGGATEEAQSNIGREVADTLVRFMKTGSTRTCVNFPMVELSLDRKVFRLLNIHQNVPGVLREINRILSEQGANIQSQSLATDPEIGYLIIDLDQAISIEAINAIQALKTSLRTRVLSV